MEVKQLLAGTGVALVTPMDARGVVDYEALGRLIDHNITNGVNYLVVLGTTAESVVLSQEEKSDTWIEDGSIALTIGHLTAHELGLGSCWIQIRNRQNADGP